MNPINTMQAKVLEFEQAVANTKNSAPLTDDQIKTVSQKALECLTSINNAADSIRDKSFLKKFFAKFKVSNAKKKFVNLIGKEVEKLSLFDKKVIKFWVEHSKPDAKLLTDKLAESLLNASDGEEIQKIFDNYKEITGKRFEDILFHARFAVQEKLSEGHLRALDEATVTRDMDPIRKQIRRNKQNLAPLLDVIDLKNLKHRKTFLQALKDERIPLDEFLNNLALDDKNYHQSIKRFFVSPADSAFLSEILVKFCERKDSLEGTKIREFIKNASERKMGGMLPVMFKETIKGLIKNKNFDVLALLYPLVGDRLTLKEEELNAIADQSIDEQFSTQEIVQLLCIVNGEDGKKILDRFDQKGRDLSEIYQGLKNSGIDTWLHKYIHEYLQEQS